MAWPPARIPLGPKAQKLIQPFLARPAEAFLFSPQEAEEHRNEQRGRERNPNRITKVYPCELRAREIRRQHARRRKSKCPKGVCYTSHSYRRVINYGIAWFRNALHPTLSPTDLMKLFQLSSISLNDLLAFGLSSYRS